MVGGGVVGGKVVGGVNEEVRWSTCIWENNQTL